MATVNVRMAAGEPTSIISRDYPEVNRHAWARHKRLHLLRQMLAVTLPAARADEVAGTGQSTAHAHVAALQKMFAMTSDSMTRVRISAELRGWSELIERRFGSRNHDHLDVMALTPRQREARIRELLAKHREHEPIVELERELAELQAVLERRRALAAGALPASAVSAPAEPAAEPASQPEVQPAAGNYFSPPVLGLVPEAPPDTTEKRPDEDWQQYAKRLISSGHFENRDRT